MKRTRGLGLALGMAVFGAKLAVAGELPEAVIPAGVGVNIHFVQGHQRDLDLIAAAGFKFVRMDFGWEAIERKKGEYDWSAYDELTRNLEAHRLRAIYILDYSHRLYEEQVDSKNALKTSVAQKDTASPQHAESIAAYAAWAAAAVRHYHGRHIVWEIWNEPNGFFWKPKPNAEQYSALAVAAGKAIREADPEATLIGPALSGFEPPFMETFLKSGALQYLDAVSVHPYRGPKKGPETAAVDYEKLREKIAQYAPTPEKKKLPIISGEWGYSTKIGDVTPEVQAAYLVRQQLFNLFEGVPLSIWYDWKNDGTDPHEVEHNFGTVTDKLEPKPAYEALKVMTRELAGYRIEKTRYFTPGTNDFVLWFSKASGSRGAKVVAWTVGEPHLFKFSFPEKPGEQISVVNGKGEVSKAREEGGYWPIELEQLPKYIALPAR